MLERNKKLALDFIQSMSVGDAAGVAAVLAPDARVVSKGFSSIAGERDAERMIANIQSLKELFPTGLRPIIHSVIADADRVAVEFDGNAVLANGVPYCNQYVMTFTIDGGKIKLINEYFCSKLVEEVVLPLMRAGF